MKNKLPEQIPEQLIMSSTDSKINQIIAYLQEKEDIAKKNRLEAFTKAWVESAKRVRDKSPEIIRVPDNIVFHKPIGNRNESVGLINGKQQLYYSFDDNIWHVWNNNNSKPIPMQLVKCNYGDIEVWDFFYAEDNDEEESELHSIDNISEYWLKLNNWFQWWTEWGCLLWRVKYDQYYKVTPIQ